MKTYEHVIVGTGQATGTLLGRLIDTGDSIAVIEGHLVGGSCVNYGCTPTKALVASARAMYQVRRGDELGFAPGAVNVDFARVRERMNEIRHGSSDSLTKWMAGSSNVELIRGWAAFVVPESPDDSRDATHLLRISGDPTVDPESHRGSEQTIRGRKIYLNPGTRAVAPPIEGLDDVAWLDSEGLLDVEHLPEHLLVVGGGYVGLELAQVFHRFGSRVTVFQRGPEVMPREDADVAGAIRSILQDEGIRIHCDASVKRATQGRSGVSLEVLMNGETELLDGSHVLVAAGRRPNSDRLNLESIGIEADQRGFIQVDDHCRTRVPGIWALGDVNGHGAFTHTSVNDAEIVLDQLFGTDSALTPRKLSDRHHIHALFTDPPLGRVGLTEAEALETSKRVGKARRSMNRIARAKEMGETRGFAKILVDLDTGLFLGATVLGPGGDEIVNMFATAIYAGMTWQEFRRCVLVHPTVSELMPWTLDELEEIKQR